MIQAQQHIDILPTFGSVIATPCDVRFGFSVTIEVGPGVQLSPEGDAPGSVYWIEEGVVKKVLPQPDGSRSVVGLRTKGWIVGAAASLIPSAREPIAVTATKCSLRAMPVETFVKAYQEVRILTKYVTNMLAVELALRLRESSSVRHAPLRARVEQFLNECALVSRTFPEGIPPLKLKQAEIAQIMGSSPATLHRLLNQMEQEGVLANAKMLLN